MIDIRDTVQIRKIRTTVQADMGFYGPLVNQSKKRNLNRHIVKCLTHSCIIHVVKLLLGQKRAHAQTFDRVVYIYKYLSLSFNAVGR